MPRYKAELSEAAVQRSRRFQAHDVIDTEGKVSENQPFGRPMAVGITKEAAELIVAALNGPDQEQVDWSVVRDAIMDTADEDGLGAPKALQASFNTHGLLVAHKD